ncbi:hypothetical protein OE09_0026 [Flavobacteriaceae bacterium MAR_2010_72]|nr:hypothetical protein OE09_0026 [Flavobacteriaceae bacterium MAR_2010_72]TVZ58269.1 hypothetical protein NA63_0765 [Flavobacteriaceae bacterium MAR_2010_105]
MSFKIKKSKYSPLYIYIYVLLFFGLAFTKTQIFGPLYLHDLVLILFTIYSLTVRRLSSIKHLALFVFICISIIYLFYSLSLTELSQELKIVALRQFMLYFYFIIAFIFYNQYIKNHDIYPLIKFLKNIGFVSIALQIFYFLYLILFNYNNFSLFEGYNYYSPAIMFGIINFGAYVLVYKKGVLKWTFFLMALLLSTLLGHASLFLAVFTLALMYFLIKVNLKGKIIAILLVIISVSILLFLPQFQDNNASWRLMFWGELSNIMFLDNFGIFGEGFGQPYASNEFAQELYDKLGSQGFFDRSKPLERWVSPPHNSFLTICFHTGFISLVLLFEPLKKAFAFFFVNTDVILDRNKLFLLLLLLGYMVWVSFNVILELPHSAFMFWLAYFVAIEYFNSKKRLNEHI